MKRVRIRSARYVLAVLLGSVLLAALPALCVAQPYDVPPTWGGDFWDRPRLTGSWWGLRDELGKKGVVFDADILLSPQGVMSGGKDTGWNFWGNADYTLNIDTGKLGLWPGGFFKFYGDSSFGESVFDDVGAIVPVNTWLLLPKPDEPSSGAPERDVHAVSQPQVRPVRGQDLHARRVQGRVRRRHPQPVHEHGAGLPHGPRPGSVLGVRRRRHRPAVGGRHSSRPWRSTPTARPRTTTSPRRSTTASLVVATGQVTIKPFGLVGHQTVGGHVERQEPSLADPGPVQRRALSPDGAVSAAGESGSRPPAILERFPPIFSTRCDPRTPRTAPGPCIYGFDQYLWQPAGDPKRGDRTVLQLRRRRRGYEPDQVQLCDWDRGQRGRPGTSARQLRGRLGPHPVQRRSSFRSCASGSTSVSTRRTRSRCSTTPRSPSGSDEPRSPGHQHRRCRRRSATIAPA